MAISGNSTYIPTMDEFLAHWGLCNAALGASPLVVVPPGKALVNVAAFDGQRTGLLVAQTAVQSALNDREIARGDINLKKTALLARLNEFNHVMDAFYQGTKFYAAKPYAPSATMGQEGITAPLIDMMTLWEKMNAGPAPAGVTLPLRLSDNYDQGQMASEISALQFAYRAERTAEQDVTTDRAQRNKLQDAAYEVMKAYRQTVPARLANNQQLVDTMPRLTPEPGHTPEPVQASGTFTAPSTSHIVHTASNEPTLSHYELEGCNGAEFRADDAVNLGRHEPNEANEFTVAFGLTQPGTAASFKVFVVLTTGNRAGSATVVIQRPA